MAMAANEIFSVRKPATGFLKESLKIRLESCYSALGYAGSNPALHALFLFFSFQLEKAICAASLVASFFVP